MTTYSHSKLGTFQQCKQKYKFHYIDKVKGDISSLNIKSIDAVNNNGQKLTSKVISSSIVV